MDIQKFIDTRMSNNDASGVLAMKGENIKEFKEKRIIAEIRGDSPAEVIKRAQVRLVELAIELRAEYVSSTRTDFCCYSLNNSPPLNLVYSGMALIRKSIDLHGTGSGY